MAMFIINLKTLTQYYERCIIKHMLVGITFPKKNNPLSLGDEVYLGYSRVHKSAEFQN